MEDRGRNVDGIVIKKLLPRAWAACKTQIKVNIREGRTAKRAKKNQDPLQAYAQLQFFFVVTSTDDRIRTLQFRCATLLQANAAFRPSELALLKIAMFPFAVVDEVRYGVVVSLSNCKTARVASTRLLTVVLACCYLNYTAGGMDRA